MEKKLETSDGPFGYLVGNRFTSFLLMILVLLIIFGISQFFTKNVLTLNSVSPAEFGRFSY